MTSYKPGDVLIVPFPFSVSFLAKRLVRRHLGTLSTSDLTKVKALFKKVLDLA